MKSKLAVFLAGMLMGGVSTLLIVRATKEKQKKEPYKGKPMDKRRKLDEATFFYGYMPSVLTNRKHFEFYLSAFLSAARSVLQYACEETDQDRNPNAKRGAKKWYDRAMKSRVLKFFRDERNDNIHETPITPSGHIVIVVPGPIRVTYRFGNWKGPEDVLQLGKTCLEELENFISDGVSQGFITE